MLILQPSWAAAAATSAQLMLQQPVVTMQLLAWKGGKLSWGQLLPGSHS